MKSFGWVGKVLSYGSQYSAKDDNSEFLLPSMAPCVKLKLRVIVFWHRAKNDNSEFELSLPTNSMCQRKILSYPFFPYIKAITRNSSESSLWPDTQSFDIRGSLKTRRFTLDTKVPNSTKRLRHKMRDRHLHACYVEVTALRSDQITLQPKLDLNNVTCIYRSIFSVIFSYFVGDLKYK